MRPEIKKEEIEVKVADLVFYENNPKEHTPIQVQDLAQSIVDFGFHTSICIDEGNVIISGHGRALAAKRLGLKTIRAIRVNGLDERKKRIARIGLNKIRRDSGIEPNNMQGLYELAESGFDIERYCWERPHTPPADSSAQSDKPTDKLVPIKFTFDEVLYNEVWQQLSIIKQRHKFLNDGQTLIWLLGQHAEANVKEG